MPKYWFVCPNCKDEKIKEYDKPVNLVCNNPDCKTIERAYTFDCVEIEDMKLKDVEDADI